MRDLPGRLAAAWRALAPQQRWAGAAAAALFVTMFLPWYTKTTTAIVGGRLDVVDKTLIAWGAFSFVEAAVLLVAAGTLALLFVRGEGATFRLPFGDGGVLIAAGAWVCLLVFWRTLDQPGAEDAPGIRTDYGVTWGIFAAFAAGIALTLAGLRLRHGQAGPPPPAVPRDAPKPPDDEPPTEAAPTRVATPKPKRAADGPEQLTLDD